MLLSKYLSDVRGGNTGLPRCRQAEFWPGINYQAPSGQFLSPEVSGEGVVYVVSPFEKGPESSSNLICMCHPGWLYPAQTSGVTLHPESCLECVQRKRPGLDRMATGCQDTRILAKGKCLSEATSHCPWHGNLSPPPSLSLMASL